MSLLKRLLLVVPVLFAVGLITSATGQNSPQASDTVVITAADVNSPQVAGEVTAAASADVTGPLSFVGVTPCRIVETRGGQGFSGQAGPPALIANQQRTFQITGTVPGVPKQCGIPSTAVAISVNFTVTGFSSGGDLRIYPAGSATAPLASIINFKQENVANATNMPLGLIPGQTEKGFTVQADGASTDFIADVNGYFVPRHFTTLESGQTEKGVYSIYYTAAAANEVGIAAISFPVPISWSGWFTLGFVLPGGSPTSSCPGDYNNPQAKPGCLCVYEATAANVAGRGWASLQDGSPLSGVGYQVHSSGAGVTYSRGSWAATAPSPHREGPPRPRSSGPHLRNHC